MNSFCGLSLIDILYGTLTSSPNYKTVANLTAEGGKRPSHANQGCITVTMQGTVPHRLYLVCKTQSPLVN